MSVNAVVENGKVVDTNNSSAKKEKTSNGYDKDAFMNILCAQMKYQDPLEPTSNTEYINQYATFTQVEQLSNMAESFAMSRASEMVGKTVIVTDDNGNKVQGKVDYVTYSGGEAYLNIDGKDYKMDTVSSVADSKFVEAHDQADDLVEMIEKFPDYNNLNYTHANDIYTAYNFYQNMSSDAIALVDKKYITELEKYKARADELVTEAVKNETEYEKQQAEKATKTESTNTESNNEGGSETTA
ncbi:MULTISPECIES: flagellar hook capping FlgD N-terminal domain-containing protein [unclassified Butyrivibrio]|uniref:flagellar hook capping FlgD N-terminal domain-containing protein n=1 Tax=unclassified Butyrivibrio TaxID=2639466 RepID=UPI000407CAE0|nr:MULTISPECIES: flagellar hook capping FlgD N-terminal domain-containing protein [unclassified Butyrivibrio]